MEMPGATAFLSGVFALAALLLLKPLAVRMKLLDAPNQRKVHRGMVPLIGGVSVYLGLLLAWLLSMPLSDGYGLYLLCSFFLVALGVADDALDLPASLRLLMQTLLATILTLGSGLSLVSLGDLVGVGQLSMPWLGPLLTIAAYVGAVNAFNMIDGIDGLAGSLSLIALLSLAVLFARAGASGSELALSLGLSVALVPYLMANLRIPPFREKIFMGDAGAMFIGFSLVWLLVRGTQGGEPALRPVTALWLIALPLMDMVAIMICRIRSGRPVMLADQGHLHHMSLRAGLTARQSLLVLSMAGVLMAAAGLSGELAVVAEPIMFVVFLVLFAVYCWALHFRWQGLAEGRRRSTVRRWQKKYQE